MFQEFIREWALCPQLHILRMMKVGEFPDQRRKCMPPNQIQIDYTYTQHFKTPFLYPLNWMFTHLFWKKYMNQVLENIRVIAESDETIE
jgi:hypothetical protein